MVSVDLLLGNASVESGNRQGIEELMPERQLLVQVFLKAIDDLKNGTMGHRFSAAEFLVGPVAEEYIGHLGLPSYVPKQKNGTMGHRFSAAEFLVGPVAEEYIGHLGLPS